MKSNSIIITALLLLFSNACGNTNLKAKNKKEPARLKSNLETRIKNGEFPGLAYGVLNEKGFTFEFYGGKADLKSGRPVGPETTFMLNSSTKTLTAAGIHRLVEMGKLDWKDPLNKYVPDHPYGNEINLEMLAEQSSGIPNPLPINWLYLRTDSSSFNETEALQNILKKHNKTGFTPGNDYAYSNISYWLLGQVIEKASGKSYCTFMREDVFAPLGIPPEALDCDVIKLQNHAKGYFKRFSLMGLFFRLMGKKSLLGEKNGPWQSYRDLQHFGPAYGGLNGTLKGTAAFLQDLLRKEPRLLNLNSRKLFFGPRKTTSGKSLPTTLGWHNCGGGKVICLGKPGGGPGFFSNVRVYPEQGMATVLLVNTLNVSESDINKLSDELDGYFVDTGK